MDDSKDSLDGKEFEMDTEAGIEGWRIGVLLTGSRGYLHENLAKFILTDSDRLQPLYAIPGRKELLRLNVSWVLSTYLMKRMQGLEMKCGILKRALLSPWGPESKMEFAEGIKVVTRIERG